MNSDESRLSRDARSDASQNESIITTETQRKVKDLKEYNDLKDVTPNSIDPVFHKGTRTLDLETLNKTMEQEFLFLQFCKDLNVLEQEHFAKRDRFLRQQRVWNETLETLAYQHLLTNFIQGIGKESLRVAKGYTDCLDFFIGFEDFDIQQVLDLFVRDNKVDDGYTRLDIAILQYRAGHIQLFPGSWILTSPFARNPLFLLPDEYGDPFWYIYLEIWRVMEERIPIGKTMLMIDPGINSVCFHPNDTSGISIFQYAVKFHVEREVVIPLLSRKDFEITQLSLLAIPETSVNSSVRDLVACRHQSRWNFYNQTFVLLLEFVSDLRLLILEYLL